jgi:hypothetical protein
MSVPKKGFGDFVRRSAVSVAEVSLDSDDKDQTPGERLIIPTGTRDADVADAAPSVGNERFREVTSTGRVRTHSANRQLPGITLRVNEERWEKLKMMSMQERRPLQEILGEALERYMKERGLPW